MSIDREAMSKALSRSLFAKFPERALDHVLAIATPLDAPAGGVIYQEAGQSRCVLVVSGLIRVYMTAERGREVTVRYARSGDVLGIPTIVGGPAPVDVEIISDAQVLAFPVELLRSLARTEPEIGWLFATEVTRRLYDTLEALAGNTFGTVRQRVARHLLDLAASSNSRPLVASVTQQDLAAAVGSVRAVVARSLGELRDAGLVGSSSAGITILDPDRLLDEAWSRGV
ncbi:MAG: Crp/Fnr family transcriptional regulator [Thermomicrobiales bacterium]